MAIRAINSQIKWNNIASDARRYPELAELQSLNAARDQIRSLLERDDLIPLDVEREDLP